MNFSGHSSFQEVLQTARTQVQEYLNRADETIIAVARSAPDGVSERMMKLIQRKGKKVRSTVLALIATAGKELPESDRVAHACAGVELLHLASLVHDDIIDGTTLRRGERTAHVEWGNKVAVLMGDYILSQAMRAVIHEKEREIPLELSSAANRLIVGEICELDSTGDVNISLERYNRIIEGKTAALIEASARIGAFIAGFSKDDVEKFCKIGSHVGIAFQIIDDLLDYGVGASNLDKAKFTDISNGLTTLPLILYLQHEPENNKQAMQELLTRTAEVGVPEEICRRLQKSSAFDKTKEMAMQHIMDASEISDSLPKNEHIEMLKAFLLSMAERGN